MKNAVNIVKFDRSQHSFHDNVIRFASQALLTSKQDSEESYRNSDSAVIFLKNFKIFF